MLSCRTLEMCDLPSLEVVLKEQPLWLLCVHNANSFQQRNLNSCALIAETLPLDDLFFNNRHPGGNNFLRCKTKVCDPTWHKHSIKIANVESHYSNFSLTNTFVAKLSKV